ncbi:MAG: energy transducer TonB [Candidatus Omnitrophica bacterium]|nr:energy transducer TonB [Candidatus Omnitrophota bacterium]
MLSNHIIRMALLISLSVHAIALSPWKSFYVTRDREDISQNIEVYYVVPKERDSKLLETLPQICDVEKKETKFSKSETKDDFFTTSGIEDSITSVNKELSNNLEEYIQYYELIREKIRKEASDTYKYGNNEGEVGVSFEVDSAGIIKKISHIPRSHSADNRLVNLALESVEKSSPFPAFPKTFKKDSLTFNLTVVFEK